MRFFFRSKNFKVFTAIVLGVVIVVMMVGFFTKVSSPISSFVGTITAPIQNAFNSFGNWIDGVKTKMGDNEELLLEIEKLKSENAELSEQIVSYDGINAENEMYEQYLGIKDKNPEMLFQSASVNSRDLTDPYKSFTIDVGIMDGVSLYDPIITAEGLVGYITEIAPMYSKVTTILSSDLKAGGRDSRTLDDGILSGRSDLANDNKCYMYNLKRDCSVSTGDFVITTGGSVFPKGLIVGRVDSIKQFEEDGSLYAIINSKVDFDNIKEVMVITYFQGQGYAGPSGEKQ